MKEPIMQGDSLGAQMRVLSDLQIFSERAMIGQVKDVRTFDRTPSMLQGFGNEKRCTEWLRLHYYSFLTAESYSVQ